MRAAFFGKVVGALLFTWYFWYCIFHPDNSHFVDVVNLIFHETGHAICFFLPALVTAAAGSGFQLLIPFVCILYFIKRREVMSAALLALWLAQSLVTVSRYVRDAIPMQLQLLGGDSSTHDWNFILSALHMLSYSITIADMLYAIAIIILIGGTSVILYSLYTSYENT